MIASLMFKFRYQCWINIVSPIVDCQEFVFHHQFFSWLRATSPSASKIQITTIARNAVNIFFIEHPPFNSHNPCPSTALFTNKSNSQLLTEAKTININVEGIDFKIDSLTCPGIYISTDNVEKPFPVTKKVTAKSSSEYVKP